MSKYNTILLTGLSALALTATTACAPRAAVQPVERGLPVTPPSPAARPEGVATALVGGTEPAPTLPSGESTRTAPRGNIEFTIPSADVRTLAQIVLRDTLRIPYTVSEDGDFDVSLTTAGPVSRQQLLDLFEASLKKAGLAMVWEGTGYRIMTVDAAKARGTEFLADRGFGSETVRLQFANADELRRLLDTVVPGAVQSLDTTQNALVIAGTEAQRKSVHSVIDQFDVNWLRSMSFALYVPQHLDSRLIVPELDKLINAPDAPTRGLVRLIGMDKINGVIAISAQKEYLEDVRRWVEVLDREGTSNEARLYVYRVQNSRARDLVKTINTTFGIGGASSLAENPDPFATDQRSNGPDNGPGQTGPSRQPPPPPPQQSTSAPDSGGTGLKVRISADEINNAVVVYGSAHDYAILEDALRKLDVPPVQVMIEAAITEVGLNDGLRYGVQWNFQTGQSNFALSEGTTSTPTRTFPGFSYFYSNNNDISATLNALEQRTTVKVVSAPKLMVLNNQTAALQVGDQVPVLAQQVTPLGGGSSTGNLLSANTVEYRDTGVILKITPRVNASGAVLLDVSQEVSDVQPTKSGVANSPTITTRRVATTVSVQDGQVIALGGLFRDSKSFGKNGLPILSRVPVLGGLLFGNNDNSQKRTELIILIKPHVLRTPDDLTAITEELRAKIQSVEPFKTKGKIP
ncbi:type II secretion system protein GspD [Novosphingobium sediminis]|uniref:Type II secretion system protein GspD n=1 Tax=Novosphingobium sediminis TaxID=707214 RepID=A0A512AHC4_9SPHN|nr:type II secretion system secretin GspD [Novosphingobium sediminis]GEN99032.1 type II secretion system protein GspD [Novosphingobium sediminis]